MSVCLYNYVFCLSVCLWVVCLAVGRSICLPFSRSVSLSVCGQSVYVPICVPLSVYICLSVCLSLSLSVCRSVGRSVASLSELSVSHGVHEACRQRRGEDHDAESESGRLRTQERQIGLMNVELRTGAESRGLRARS